MKKAEIEKIIVLHEYGATKHYQGLCFAASERGVEVEFREFGVIRQFARGGYRRDISLVFRSVRNMIWLAASWLGFVRGKKVVIGIAPFDWQVLLVLPIILSNKVYWHTSWPYWSGFDGLSYPKLTRSRLVKHAWRRFLFDKLVRGFFVTDFSRSNFERGFGRKIASSVVYHSYDPSIFFFEERRVKSAYVAGFVGRFDASKGVREVINLSKKTTDLPIEYVFVGAGPLAGDISNEARLSNGRVKLAGFLKPKELGDLYRNLDFLLLPSIRTPKWEEAFGMVIIEAMACGVVPIATDHPGPVEILTGELTSNVFSEDDYQQGALSLMTKLMRDEIALSRIRFAAIKCARQFMVGEVANRWSSLFEVEDEDF